MTQWTRDSQVGAFLEAVCSKIKNKNVHGDVCMELENHLSELTLMKAGQGDTEEEAVSWAIRQMGDPLVIGNQLQQVYKPRVRWSLPWITHRFHLSGIACHVRYST